MFDSESFKINNFLGSSCKQNVSVEDQQLDIAPTRFRKRNTNWSFKTMICLEYPSEGGGGAGPGRPLMPLNFLQQNAKGQNKTMSFFETHNNSYA